MTLTCVFTRSHLSPRASSACTASMSFDPWSLSTVEAYRRPTASLDLLTSLGNPFETVSEQERQHQTLLTAAASFATEDVDTEPPSPPSNPLPPTKEEVEAEAMDEDGAEAEFSATHSDVDWNDPDFLEMEAEAAKANDIPWQARGPPPPWMGGPSTWRGQPCRKDGKWMKRGGKNLEYWTEHYRFLNSAMNSKGAAGKNSGKGSSGVAGNNSGKSSGGATGRNSGKGSSGATGKTSGEDSKVNKGSGKKGGGKAPDEGREESRARSSSSGLRR